MLDEEVGWEPEGEDVDELNLEVHMVADRASGIRTRPETSPEKADLDDTVTLFEGKNTRV